MVECNACGKCVMGVCGCLWLGGCPARCGATRARLRTQVEEALSRLLDMANQDPNNVPVLLAMATGVCAGGARGQALLMAAVHVAHTLLACMPQGSCS